MAKRPRPSRVDDDEEDIPPPANYVAPPQPWVNDGAAAKEVREILDAPLDREPRSWRDRRADAFRTSKDCSPECSLVVARHPWGAARAGACDDSASMHSGIGG